MANLENAQQGLQKAGKVAKRWLLILVAVLIVAAVIYTWVTLNWSYSEGQHAGVLQKFERKGWICKTYEGELTELSTVQGMSPQIWRFTVRDNTLAEQLRKVVGEKVQLHYTEHSGVPSSCFADTPYYVDSVKVLTDQPLKP
jgi:hypothetical protein